MVTIKADDSKKISCVCVCVCEVLCSVVLCVNALIDCTTRYTTFQYVDFCSATHINVR